MAISVTRTRRALIRPLEQTPSSTLVISAIDSLPVLRCNARTLHVFGHSPAHAQAAQVIKEALSKALIPYYPLAGRLKDSAGKLQIECSGEGVWFVEAFSDCALEYVNYFDNVSSTTAPYDELLPDQVPQVNGMDPLVQMQVTQFDCGGFVVGLIFCHSICDGLGAAQFLNAIGEMARGLENPTISPVWRRDFSPLFSQQAIPTTLPMMPPTMPDYVLEHTNIDISTNQINKLKREFHSSTHQTCSVFEVVAALFWKSRTKAINFEQNTELKLVFFANCREALDPPLPEGFYGNCFFPVTITTSAESLMGPPNFEVIKNDKGNKEKVFN